MTTIRVFPDRDLLRILTALEVRWDLAISSNGDGNWALVEVDEATDQRLLEVWDRLTDLRVRYLDWYQRHVQPLLPGLEDL
jgi:hypothetical protein